MSPPRVGPFAILETRHSGARSLSVLAIAPDGRRVAVQVPRHLSGPDGLLAALEASWAAWRRVRRHP